MWGGEKGGGGGNGAGEGVRRRLGAHDAGRGGDDAHLAEELRGEAAGRAEHGVAAVDHLRVRARGAGKTSIVFSTCGIEARGPAWKASGR